MIGKLKGRLDELKPTELILDVNGVGYSLSIPFTTYEKIQKQKEISLYVYTLHKEDQLKLFGFFSFQEKQLFSLLLNISGIGPTMALSILSGVEIEMLVEAVKSDNPSILTRIPGIGKNKAEKLIFELKRKINLIEADITAFPKQPSLRNEAVEALVSLGFDELRSSKTIEDIIKKSPDITIENIIKNALINLSS